MMSSRSTRLDDPDPMIRAWTIQLATEHGAAGYVDPRQVRRAGADAIPHRWSVSTWPRPCNVCRWSSAGRSSPGWSAIPRTRPIRISRSWTGMPPNHWPRSTRAVPRGWRPRRGSPASRSSWRAGSVRSGTPRVAGDPGRGAGPCSLDPPVVRRSCRDRGGPARPSASGDARGVAQGLRDAGHRCRCARSLAGRGAGLDVRRSVGACDPARRPVRFQGRPRSRGARRWRPCSR